MLRDANGEERTGIEVLDIKAIHDYAYMGWSLPKEQWWRLPDKHEINRAVEWVTNPCRTWWGFKLTILRTETIRDLMLAGF